MLFQYLLNGYRAFIFVFIRTFDVQNLLVEIDFFYLRVIFLSHFPYQPNHLVVVLVCNGHLSLLKWVPRFAETAPVDHIHVFDFDTFIHHHLKDQQIARIEAFGIPKINLKLTVFNQNEEQVWSVNETGEMENEIITNLGLKSNANYFLKVENIGRSANLDEQYAICLNANQFSAFEEFEPNNQKDEATPINLDTSVRGYIHSVGDEDFYKLDLSNRRITGVKLTLKGMVKVNTDIALYDADLKKIAEANSRQSEETEIISAKVTPAIYYIKVYDNDGKESNYRDQYELIVLAEQ